MFVRVFAHVLVTPGFVWRRLLVVQLIAAAVIGILLQVIDATASLQTTVIATVVVGLVVGLAATCVHAVMLASPGAPVSTQLRQAADRFPAVSVQVTAAVAVVALILVALWGVWHVVGNVAIVGLLLALPYIAHWLLIASVAVIDAATAEHALLPRRASAMLRGRQRAAALIWATALSVAAVWLVVVGGFIGVIAAMVVFQPVSLVVYALCTAPVSVAMSLVARSVWKQLAGRQATVTLATDQTVAPSFVAPATDGVAAQFAVGPIVEGVVQPAGQAGEWIMVALPGVVTVRASWSAGASPMVIACDQAGNWQQLGTADVSGLSCELQATASGWWWIGLASYDPVAAQAWRLETWTPAAIAAA